MPRTGLAYERPSRVSQGLIVGFSLAVVVMAGWLVMMIMFSHDANTMAAAPAQVPAAPSPPQVENAAPEPIRLITVTRPTAQSTTSESSPWPYTPYSSAPAAAAPSALPLAAPRGAAPAPAYSTSSIPAAVPDTNERNIDEPPPRIEAAIEAPEAVPEVIPLPPPKPRRVASIPVPRPRPHLDGDDAPPPERSFFDMLLNPQR